MSNLLVVDLDGTLYQKDHPYYTAREIEVRNIRAIYKWVNAGNFFAVATARELGHYEYLCDKLGFKVNFIGANGAQIIFDDGSKVFFDIPLELLFELKDYILVEGIDASASTIFNGHWLWTTKSNYPIFDSDSKRYAHAEIVPEDINKNDKVQRVAFYARKDIIPLVKKSISDT